MNKWLRPIPLVGAILILTFMGILAAAYKIGNLAPVLIVVAIIIGIAALSALWIYVMIALMENEWRWW